MSEVDPELRKRIYELVVRIPRGKVMTYGQLAALCGAPGSAWEVGQIAHTGPNELPWQRVVNKQGGLAEGWPGGGKAAHRLALEADGVSVNDNFTVNIKELLWNPHQTQLL